MIKKNTQIVLLVFGILLVVVFALRQRPAAEEEEFPTPTPDALAFLDFSALEVVSIRVEDAEGSLVLAERGEGEGTWTLIEPEAPAEETDAATIEAAVGEATRLTALSTFDEAPEAEVLGLDPPQYTITILLESGEEIVILVGNVTPPDTGYYVQVTQANDEATAVVGKFGLDPILDLLRMPPILGTPTPLPETATIEAMTPSVEATEEGGTVEGETASPETTEDGTSEGQTPSPEATGTVE